MKAIFTELYGLGKAIFTTPNMFPNYLFHIIGQEWHLLARGKFKAALNYTWVMAFSREEGVGITVPLYKKNHNLVPYPARLELEVTTKCRLKCPKCEHTYWQQPDKSLSFEQFKTIIDQFPGLKEVSLTGIGHGLEHDGYFDMLRYLKKKSIFVQFFDPLLLADEAHKDGAKSDAQIAEVVDVSGPTAHRIRRRFSQEGLQAALGEKSRPGRAKKFTAKQRAEITALACSDPPEGHARWSLRLLADKLVELEIVESIHHDTVREVLKKTNFSHTSSASGALAS